ncbi:hypothetical protein Y032_0594g419 [Ancylostoma ceylanicum]|uniref:Uncharacterized protein n=1 Tax=Ancylostoma ceylanicum TaxID=53326 RepID=A0A016WMK5_9BILA|nr:hypothetical protein Y032_0594g419 [Ancylostoma ceylanicum]
MSYTSRYSSSYASRFGDTSTRSSDSTTRYGDYSSRYGSRSDYSSRYRDYSGRKSGKDLDGEYGSQTSSYSSRYKSRLYGEDDNLSKKDEANFETEEAPEILPKEEETNLERKQITDYSSRISGKDPDEEYGSRTSSYSSRYKSKLYGEDDNLSKKDEANFETKEAPEILPKKEETNLERKQIKDYSSRISGKDPDEEYGSRTSSYSSRYKSRLYGEDDDLPRKGANFESEEAPEILPKEEELNLEGKQVPRILTKKKEVNFESEQEPEIPSEEEKNNFGSKEVSEISRVKEISSEDEEIQEITVASPTAGGTENDSDDTDGSEVKSDALGGDEIYHDAEVKSNRYGDNEEERSITPRDQQGAITVETEDEYPRMVVNSPESAESPEPLDDVEKEAENVESLPTPKRSLVKEKPTADTQDTSEPRQFRIPINQSIPKRAKNYGYSMLPVMAN